MGTVIKWAVGVEVKLAKGFEEMVVMRIETEEEVGVEVG